MPVFTKRLVYADLGRRNTTEVDAVVDTGSAYCVVSQSLAGSLGLEHVSSSQFVLADGRVVEFPVAGLRLELNGKVAFTNVAIVPDPAEPILGALGLAALGLGVEPATEKLIPEVIRLLTITGWRTI